MKQCADEARLKAIMKEQYGCDDPIFGGEGEIRVVPFPIDHTHLVLADQEDGRVAVWELEPPNTASLLMVGPDSVAELFASDVGLPAVCLSRAA